jgi:hypothetical protein
MIMKNKLGDEDIKISEEDIEEWRNIFEEISEDPEFEVIVYDEEE